MSEWKICICGEEYRTETSYLCDKCKSASKRNKLTFQEYFKLKTGSEPIIPEVKKKIVVKKVDHLRGATSILKVKPLKYLYR